MNQSNESVDDDDDTPTQLFVRPARRVPARMMPVERTGLWDATDVARYLKVSRSWVYHRAEAGQLPHLRVGGLLRLVTSSVGHDASNRVTSELGQDGQGITASYSAAGDLLSLTPPDRPAHVFTYTAAGDQQSYVAPMVDGSPAVTTLAYDLDRQPTLITRPGGQTVGFVYDTAGRLSTTTYPREAGNAAAGTLTDTETYTTSTGQLATQTTSDGEGLTFTYDGSLMLSVSSSGSVVGTVSVTYDNNFRPVTQTIAGVTRSTTYDADGLVTGLGALTIVRHPANGFVTGTTLANVSDSVGHNSFGEQSNYEATLTGATLFSEATSRDDIGRIEQRTETIGGVTTIYLYSYDPAGRLWQVMADGNLTATYLYDANGNRTSRVTPSGSEAGTHDAQDRVLTYGKWSFTYTPNGEIKTKTDTTSSAITRYTYDGMGGLRRVELSDGRVVEYAIDPEGRRVAKKVDGVVVRRWLYGADSLYPVAELDGAGVIVSRLVAHQYLVKAGITYRVISDQLGSPRLVVNASTGTVAQRLDYDEFGRVLADSAPGFQPFGFAGGLYDADTGLVRFGERDYDAEIGRWTAKDPIDFAGRDTLLYCYASNDPLNVRDPSGLRQIEFMDKPDPNMTGDPLTPAEIAQIKAAIKKIEKTKKGRKMLRKIRKSPNRCVISRLPGQGSEPDNYKGEIMLKPGSPAYVYTQSVMGVELIEASTLERDIAHEGGHWLGEDDDLPAGQRNWDKYENPIMQELGQNPHSRTGIEPWRAPLK